MLQTLAHSAVAGFGASAGRDTYKEFKNGNPALVAIAGLFLVTWGYRGIARNAGNATRSNRPARIIGNAAAALVGTALIYGVFVILTPEESRGNVVWITLGFHAISALVGTLWGNVVKKRELREYDVEAHNVAFMEEHGLRDSLFESDLLEDENGNRLRVKETRDDRIVFTVVGRRGLRAAISLSKVGW